MIVEKENQLSPFASSQAREIERLRNVINQFIQSCSHSMRGPLKSIQGLTDLLQNKNEYSPDSSYKLENMLDDLEQFLENSKRNVMPKEVELASVIQSILDEFEGQLQEQNITTSIKIEQHVKMHTDMNRLRIALFNIIENAIRFSDSYKDRKWIDIQGSVNFTSCTLNIMDNGIGMEPGIETKVFDLFYRGTEKSKGLGVGLYVVREVLEKMGGSVTVYSKYGTGSKFFIWLPNDNLGAGLVEPRDETIL
jgi:hypothetical protein